MPSVCGLSLRPDRADPHHAARDSITNGSNADSPDGIGGYRGPLFNALTGLGYNVDSIGSLTVNSGLLPVAQREHEGHSGWRSINSTRG